MSHASIPQHLRHSSHDQPLRSRQKAADKRGDRNVRGLCGTSGSAREPDVNESRDLATSPTSKSRSTAVPPKSAGLHRRLCSMRPLARRPIWPTYFSIRLACGLIAAVHQSPPRHTPLCTVALSVNACTMQQRLIQRPQFASEDLRLDW